LVLFIGYYKNASQVILKSFRAQTHENTPQTTVDTSVEHILFEFDLTAEFLLKYWNQIARMAIKLQK